MADGIKFSTQPFSVEAPPTAAVTIMMDLSQAINVEAYDELNLQLGVLKDPPASVEIHTSMQRETEDGWVPCGAFPVTGGVVPAGWDNLLVLPEGRPLLRFVRWKITMNADETGFFVLHGLARRKGL